MTRGAWFLYLQTGVHRIVGGSSESLRVEIRDESTHMTIPSIDCPLAKPSSIDFRDKCFIVIHRSRNATNRQYTDRLSYLVQ